MMSKSKNIFRKHYDASSQSKLDKNDFFKEEIFSSDSDNEHKENIAVNELLRKKRTKTTTTTATTFYPIMKSLNPNYVIPKKVVKDKDISSEDEKLNDKKIASECLKSFLTRSKLSSSNTSSNKNDPINTVRSTSNSPSLSTKSFYNGNSLKASYLSKPKPERLNLQIESDDSTSIEPNPMKNINFMSKEDISFHLNKIQSFTKKLNEQKLIKEKMCLPFDEQSGEDEELPNIDLDVKSPILSQEIQQEICNKKSDNLNLEDEIVDFKNYTTNTLNYITELDKETSTNDKCQLKRKTIDINDEIESRIEKIKSLNKLTEEDIEYMVLIDINYYLNIFAGNCEHSWRHKEFKKYSRKLGNHLYANSLLASFSYDQYMSAVKALQSVFCQTNNKRDEYIVKVLLPEALIKICMRIHQCSKSLAESYLQKSDYNKPIDWNQFKKTAST